MERKKDRSPMNLLSEMEAADRQRLLDAGCRPAEGFLTFHWVCPDGFTRSQQEALAWLDKSKEKPS